MNNHRRTELRAIISEMGAIRARLEEVQSAENAAVEALPGNLQYSERGERMQEIADAMQGVVDDLESMEDELESCLE